MVIVQGDLYWLDFGEPDGSEPGGRRPVVVVQNDEMNRSRINTVLICALTRTAKRAYSPGNVLLEDGEANLLNQSVVNVSQMYTVDKTVLDDYIGTLSKTRIREIIRGIVEIIQPSDLEQKPE